jgi:hypothetical protein
MTDPLNLNADIVAFGKASADLEFTLFKIYTHPIPNGSETGQFSLDATYPLSQFEKFPDPVGLLKYIARSYLLHCVQTSSVPIEKWIIEFSPIMERYQVPSHLFLETARDRIWLL